MFAIAIQFDPAVWGTVGQWVSSGVTSATLLATLYVIRRDARTRRTQQAGKIAYVEVVRDKEPGDVKGKRKHWYIGTTRNLSDEPIYDVVLMLIYPGRLRRPWDRMSGMAVLLPGDVFEYQVDYSFQFTKMDIVFRDNAGRHWQRTIDGRLIDRTTIFGRFIRSRFLIRSVHRLGNLRQRRRRQGDGA